MLHSCFVCFITYLLHPTLFRLAYTLSCRVTLATLRAQVEHLCRHLAVCTAEHLEVQVPSRPLQVVHLGGRPRVERLDHPEAHQARILHRGHPPAILGRTAGPQALDLPVLCIQVNLSEYSFPSQQLRCCCRKRKQRGWWGVHCPCLSSGCTRQGRSSPSPCWATAPTRLRASHHTPTIDSVATSRMMPTISCCRPFCSLIGNVKLLVR